MLFLWPWLLLTEVSAFWDVGSTTSAPQKRDRGPRRSKFRWPEAHDFSLQLFFPYWDWNEMEYRRRVFVMAGVSFEFVNLSVAAILNRGTVITSANYLDPYMDKQTQLRIWALGRSGDFDTPFRYRVWRITRVFPRSMNMEHCHGIMCHHVPRHDVAIIHSLDQIYVFTTPLPKFHYAFRALLLKDKQHFAFNNDDVWFSGSGYENPQHIYENFDITYSRLMRDWVVDCSRYLPKYWGKFICVKNVEYLAGVQNGAVLFDNRLVVGVGCFMVTYNEERILVFTDLRYYTDWLYYLGHIYPGTYYEYAYPAWGVNFAYSDGVGNSPNFIPDSQLHKDMYPMGRRRK